MEQKLLVDLEYVGTGVHRTEEVEELDELKPLRFDSRFYPINQHWQQKVSTACKTRRLCRHLKPGPSTLEVPHSSFELARSNVATPELALPLVGEGRGRAAHCAPPRGGCPPVLEAAPPDRPTSSQRRHVDLSVYCQSLRSQAALSPWPRHSARPPPTLAGSRSLQRLGSREATQWWR
eukprot:scaffold495_cov405-Prasinococcus_capsulatus_cf.AAC.12